MSPGLAAHHGARPDGPGFAVDVRTPIDAPPDAVWALVGHRFADIDEWSSTVDRSVAVTVGELDGAVVASGAPVAGRRTTSRAGTLTEVLVAWDDAGRSFTFDTLGLPRLLRLAQNRTTVEAMPDGGSMVVFDVRIVLHPALALLAPVLRRRMAHTFGQVQDDLRCAVEAGVVA